eukprot:1131258-Amphidinium_carterae.1
MSHPKWISYFRRLDPAFIIYKCALSHNASACGCAKTTHVKLTLKVAVPAVKQEHLQSCSCML